MTSSPSFEDASGPGDDAAGRIAARDHMCDPLRQGPMFRWLVLATLAYLGLISMLFLAAPQIDIWASGVFHDPDRGFWATSSPVLMRLRELGPFLVKLVAIASLLVLLAAILLPRFPASISLCAPIFLVSTLILGPGVLVNTILKDNWGRPRPNTVDVFGGEAPFIGVWRITDHCARNCSFVSGEGAASFWLVALAFLAPAAWRWGMLAAIVPIFLALSVNRVAFGGHFLSDTMLAWGLTLLVILGVYAALYRTRGSVTLEQQLHDRLARLGHALRSWLAGAWRVVWTLGSAVTEKFR